MIWIADWSRIHLIPWVVITLNPRVAFSFLTVAVFSCSGLPAFARVGETQEVIERRILQPNLGKLFFRAKDKDKNPRDAERDRLREEQDQPFNDVKKFFTPDTREGVYWKSALSAQLSNDDGWRVHVFYMGGVLRWKPTGAWAISSTSLRCARYWRPTEVLPLGEKYPLAAVITGAPAFAPTESATIMNWRTVR